MVMRRLILLVGLAGLSVMFVSRARAQEVDEDAREREQARLGRMGQLRTGVRSLRPGASAHDGIYFRFDLGPSYVSASFDTLNDRGTPVTATYSGFGAVAGFHLGGSIEPGTIVALHSFGAAVVNPKLSGVGQDPDAKVTLTMNGLGPELTRYFTPSNVYVTSSLGVAWASSSVTSGGVTTTTKSKAGFAALVGVGKEWWVSEHWGIGVQARMTFLAAPQPDELITYRAWTAGLGFSATYN